MKKFLDDYENMATIEKGYGLPYKGAAQKVDEFTLTLYSLYDNCKIYFLSIFETEENAVNNLKSFSCGTFKESK